VLVEDDRLGKQLVLIGNLPYTAGTVHLSHEDQVVQKDIHKVPGWGRIPGGMRRRGGGAGGSGGDESAAERGAPERWRSASEAMRGAGTSAPRHRRGW
jgi:hypothetical protein